MKMRASLAGTVSFALLLLLAVSSCATTCLTLPPLKPVQHVCGVVFNNAGEPIADAHVVILKDGVEVVSMQTGADGRFSFEQLSAGNYDIQIQAKGYLGEASAITLVKPDAKCRQELKINLAIGMGCSSISIGKPKK
jgi:Carboxypeptidase regulatory-like domain